MSVARLHNDVDWRIPALAGGVAAFGATQVFAGHLLPDPLAVKVGLAALAASALVLAAGQLLPRAVDQPGFRPAREGVGAVAGAITGIGAAFAMGGPNRLVLRPAVLAAYAGAAIMGACLGAVASRTVLN